MLSLFIILKSNISLEALVIAIAGYLIVFTALVLLFWFFSAVPRLIALGKIKMRVQTGKTTRNPGGRGHFRRGYGSHCHGFVSLPG